MKKIFVSQTKLTIEINVGADISDVASAKIKYIKPNNERGEFPATVVNANIGLIKYDVQSTNDLDIPGPWKLWPHLTYVDGKTIEGPSNTLTVHPSGT